MIDILVIISKAEELQNKSESSNLWLTNAGATRKPQNNCGEYFGAM